MNERQKLELRQSSIRSRLTELGNAEASDTGQSEIDTLGLEYGANEGRIRAFMIANDSPVETHNIRNERAELYAKASVGDLVDSLVNGRSGVKGGAMAELQQEYSLADNEIHVKQLMRPANREEYAVTPAPTDVGQNQSEIIPYVFPMACASFLGVDMPVVGRGEAIFPVLTSELSVETPAENAAGTETTGAFSADVLSPSRIQASFFYSREDRARFAGMDSSLRENLSMGLSDGLDKAIIAGTNGLLTGTNLANHNVTAVTTFANYLSEFLYGRVDGRYASMSGDIRVVVGSGTYAHMGATYRGTESEETTLDRVMRMSGGVKVSAHVPGISGNKQNSIIRRGMARDMVAPIWENVLLIPDEVTKAANGQIVLTALMMHAVKILRADGWYKQQSQHA